MVTLEIVESVDSTSDALKRLLAQGEAGERALMARQQTGGRGRLGRRWESPVGNLYLSVLLRPARLDAPGHWSILAGVALAEVTAALMPGGRMVRLKWPNDLLVGAAKLAGILVEAGFTPAPWLVIGVGANVASAPGGLERPVTCFTDHSAATEPETIATGFLAALGRWRDRYERGGFEPVRRAWLGFGPAPGEWVRSSHGKGRFAGLADDGALLLEGLGKVQAIVSGEVL